ncbi:MAG TPA: MMPL family transporter, partial [Candidatus Limnocylindrales bacterium]|nr:MMPL family transporter [Candidatus Limnocylindrales bacterium]
MNLFHRIGAASARHRRLVFAAWLLAVAVAVPLAPQASGVLRAGGFSAPDLESARARAVLEAELGLPQSVLVIIARSETSARAGDPAFEEAVARALADVPSVRHVKGIQSHLRSPRQVSADRRTVYEIVSLDLEPDRSPEVMPGIEAALHEQPGISLMLAGAPAFYGDIQAVSEADLQRSELISIPLAAVALLVVFGSVVAAGVPLIVGGASALIALAVVFLVGSLTPMSIFVLNLATLMGLGLGVDYSLLVASRFREELALRGGGRRPDGSVDQAIVDEAVAVTTGTAGRAIFFSALSVLLGVVGLLLFDFMILRSIGIAGGVVMVLGMAAALTLLPAVLSYIGPRIDALTLRRTRALPDAEGPWARFARRVMERPWQVLLPTLALLLLLGWPFLHARVNAPDATILPPDVHSRQAYDLLVRE